MTQGANGKDEKAWPASSVRCVLHLNMRGSEERTGKGFCVLGNDPCTNLCL